MNILTVNNAAFELNSLPEEVDDLRYAVLDWNDPKNVDYHFVPLIFMETFHAPAAVLKIGEHVIQVPLDWYVVIGEKEFGDPEVVPIMNINDRGFSAFVFNPISSFRPDFQPLEIINVFQDIRWFTPKLKHGHILAVPLENKEKPLCAYFVKETNKLPEVLSIEKMI
jgi:hypothetical protein